MMNNPIELVPTISCTDFLRPIVVQPHEIESLLADGWTVTWREPAPYRPRVNGDGCVIEGRAL